MELYGSKEIHILDKCCQDISEGSQIHVFLENCRIKDGKVLNKVPLSERSVNEEFTKTEFFFNLTNNFVQILITFNNKLSPEKAAIYRMYDLYRQKCSDAYRNQEDVICHLAFYFLKPDEVHGVCTKIEAHNPVMITKSDEDGTLTCLFELAGFNFGVETIDYDSIDEEIQNDIAEEVKIEEREERLKAEREEQAEFANQFVGILDEDEF